MLSNPFLVCNGYISFHVKYNLSCCFPLPLPLLLLSFQSVFAAIYVVFAQALRLRILISTSDEFTSCVMEYACVCVCVCVCVSVCWAFVTIRSEQVSRRSIESRTIVWHFDGINLIAKLTQVCIHVSVCVCASVCLCYIWAGSSDSHTCLSQSIQRMLEVFDMSFAPYTNCLADNHAAIAMQ